MDLNLFFKFNKESRFKVDNNIYLKLVSENDIYFINELHQCQDVKKYVGNFGNSSIASTIYFLAFLSRFKSNTGLDFIIYDLQDNRVGIINCVFTIVNEKAIGQVSYIIHSNFRNKGYATKALQFICNITDQSHLDALILDIHAENLPSMHIAEKLGFQVKKILDAHLDCEKALLHRECIKALPKRLELFLKANKCYKEKNYFEAITLYHESLSHHIPINSAHTDAQIYSNLGMALSAIMQYKESYIFLKRAYNAGIRNENVLKELTWLETNASQYL